MAVETEIKFSVTDSTILDSVASLDRIAGYDARDRGVRSHTDTYFDTVDRQLLHGKVVFRLRTREDISLLTFKASAGVSSESPEDGIHRRIEIECLAEATAEDIRMQRYPDLPPVTALRERMGRIELNVSLTARNNRRTILLMKEDAPRFELVLDDVVFEGPGGTKGICEIEVEKMTGTDDELQEIGAWLAERCDVAPAGPSKYILGMTLVGFTE